MSDAEERESGNLFLQMVLTLQTSAMQHLGKIASPFTGKVERDLLSAKAAIDMLAMLQEKTKSGSRGVRTADELRGRSEETRASGRRIRSGR